MQAEGEERNMGRRRGVGADKWERLWIKGEYKRTIQCRSKDNNTKQKSCKLRRNKLKGDRNLRCECVMAMFTAAVVAESLFGRTATGICVWSVSSARQSHACVCLLYNALPHLLYCARVAEIWCVCVYIRGKFVERAATPPPTRFYSIQFHQR